MPAKLNVCTLTITGFTTIPNNIVFMHEPIEFVSKVQLLGINMYLIQLDIFIVMPMRFYLISALFLVILNQDLWNYSNDRVNDMFVAWRKVVRNL